MLENYVSDAKERESLKKTFTEIYKNDCNRNIESFKLKIYNVYILRKISSNPKLNNFASNNNNTQSSNNSNNNNNNGNKNSLVNLLINNFRQTNPKFLTDKNIEETQINIQRSQKIYANTNNNDKKNIYNKFDITLYSSINSQNFQKSKSQNTVNNIQKSKTKNNIVISSTEASFMSTEFINATTNDYYNNNNKNKNLKSLSKPTVIPSNSLKNNLDIPLTNIDDSIMLLEKEEKGKNDFHLIARIFYNKRRDLNTNEIRYLTREEFSKPLRFPLYFNHLAIIKSISLKTAKINDILHENIFSFVNDIKTMDLVLDTFSETDKFSIEAYLNKDDHTYLNSLEHMVSTNAQAITTHFHLEEDKKVFKAVDGKNLFNYADFKRIRDEDKQELISLIYESNYNIGDLHNLNSYRTYIKIYKALDLNKKKALMNINANIDSTVNNNDFKKTKNNQLKNFKENINKIAVSNERMPKNNISDDNNNKEQCNLSLLMDKNDTSFFSFFEKNKRKNVIRHKTKNKIGNNHTLHSKKNGIKNLDNIHDSSNFKIVNKCITKVIKKNYEDDELCLNYDFDEFEEFDCLNNEFFAD